MPRGLFTKKGCASCTDEVPAVGYRTCPSPTLPAQITCSTVIKLATGTCPASRYLAWAYSRNPKGEEGLGRGPGVGVDTVKPSGGRGGGGGSIGEHGAEPERRATRQGAPTPARGGLGGCPGTGA